MIKCDDISHTPEHNDIPSCLVMSFELQVGIHVLKRHTVLVIIHLDQGYEHCLSVDSVCITKHSIDGFHFVIHVCGRGFAAFCGWLLVSPHAA